MKEHFGGPVATAEAHEAMMKLVSRAEKANSDKFAELKQRLRPICQRTVVGLRDRALVAVMAFTFARVSAVVGLKVEDYYPQKKRWWLRLREKNGKVNEMLCHHKLEAYIDAYIAAAGIEDDRKGHSSGLRFDAPGYSPPARCPAPMSGTWCAAVRPTPG